MAEPKESTGIERRPRILDTLGSGGLPEDQARSLAEDFVRHARDGAGRVLEGPAPDPDEVRERRESRRHTRQN